MASVMFLRRENQRRMLVETLAPTQGDTVLVSPTLAVNELIAARRAGRAPDERLRRLVPSVGDGLLGMRFIEASVNSHEGGGVWTPIGRGR